MNVDKLKITVSGMNLDAAKRLSNIISECLERDFIFRTSFANWIIAVEEKLEDLDDITEQNIQDHE